MHSVDIVWISFYDAVGRMQRGASSLRLTEGGPSLYTSEKFMIGKRTVRSLKVKVVDIPQEGMKWTIPLEEKLLETIAPDGARFSSGVQAEVFIESSGGNVSVSGSITGDAELTCVRCLKKFSFHINPHFSLVLIPVEGSPDHGERELTRERLDEEVYRHGEVDIEALIAGQIVLFLPPYPRCQESCKGLCAGCGADLNVGPCGCPEGRRNGEDHISLGSLYAQLKGLKVGKVKKGGR